MVGVDAVEHAIDGEAAVTQRPLEPLRQRPVVFGKKYSHASSRRDFTGFLLDAKASHTQGSRQDPESGVKAVCPQNSAGNKSKWSLHVEELRSNPPRFKHHSKGAEMREKQILRHKLVAAAVAAALGCAAGPALADELGDLKAEIAAQRAQLEAQRALLEAQRQRLEMMEQKLETATAKATAAQVAVEKVTAEKTTVAKATAEKPAESKSFIPGLVTGPDWEPGFKFAITPMDTVTLYGLIDATVSYISNANAKGDHKFGTQTAWFSGDRWGITGRHGVGDNTGGLIFKLESEFDYQTGEEDTPGVLFNRDAWIGYQSDAAGKITLGRQNAVARDFTGIYGDPYTAARVGLEETGYTNTNNFKQLIYYAASATGTRYDRGLVWKKEWGGFVTGLGYQFGNIPGSISSGSTQTFAFGYNADKDLFHLAGFYNQFKVGTLQHKAYSVGGNVQFGPVTRLNAGYYWYDSEQGNSVGNRKDHAWTTSAKFTPAGPMEYDIGYQIITAKNAGVNAAGNVLVPYADASGVTKTANGDKKTAYGSIFYHFDRRAEVYFVTDYMKLTDQYKLAVTNGHDNQLEVGVGVRLRF
jgi:predicted porin